MEARWLGKTYDEALVYAIPEGVDLEPYDCHTVAALLAGYYDYYGAAEQEGVIEPEVQWEPTQIGDWTIEGKMDGLGVLKDGRDALIESKTTGDSIAPDSDYWLRLRFNVQVLNYATEARRLGRDPVAFYDVTRKPSIRPKEIVDAKKTKKSAKVSHQETPEEFSERLWRDTLARPDFYFCRREVPILDDDLVAFQNHRTAIIKQIEHYRQQENCTSPETCKPEFRDKEAWPRNVSCDTCDYCDFKSFCLQNLEPNLKHPPSGLALRPFNPELERK